jgi:hypothetical protein
MTTLMPRNGGCYLNPAEVIERMQAEFAYVETSEEGARNHVLAWLEQLAFVTQTGRTAAADLYVNQLERFQDEARFVHFGDDLGADGVLLSMLMIPQQPLIIDAHGEDEETWFLIYRCAGVLDYEVFDPESIEVAAFDGNGAAAHAATA